MKPFSILMAAIAAMVSHGPVAAGDDIKPGCGHLKDDAVLQRACEIVLSSPLVDTHIDAPYRIVDGWVDVTKAIEGGDFDYVRARRGGLDIVFMSIYTPAKAEADGTAFQLANQLIDHVEAIEARSGGRMTVKHSINERKNQGPVQMALGMENGAPIEGDLEKLRHFHQRGIRYITLAHSKSNHISDSSYDENRQWNGLSPFGKQLVAEMNRLGIMIDISHVSDDAFYQVIELSQSPVIASHSSARRFTPGWERNMSDDMIKKLAENGGVIQINFGSGFITEAAREWRLAFDAERGEYLRVNRWDTGSDAAAEFQKAYREEHPYPYASVQQVADHFDHVIDLVGPDHVGIGSDFDGVGDSLPEGLKDVSQYHNLVAEFLRRDYSETDIKKILGGNLLRVWQQVEDKAVPEAQYRQR